MRDLIITDRCKQCGSKVKGSVTEVALRCRICGFVNTDAVPGGLPRGYGVIDDPKLGWSLSAVRTRTAPEQSAIDLSILVKRTRETIEKSGGAAELAPVDTARLLEGEWVDETAQKFHISFMDDLLCIHDVHDQVVGRVTTWHEDGSVLLALLKDDTTAHAVLSADHGCIAFAFPFSVDAQLQWLPTYILRRVPPRNERCSKWRDLGGRERTLIIDQAARLPELFARETE